MQITQQQIDSIPFQYANDVRTGKIVVGKRIKQAVERFTVGLKLRTKMGFISIIIKACRL
jgi:hypothetical protein